MRTPLQSLTSPNDDTGDVTIAWLGATFNFIVRSADTAGTCALIEGVVPPHSVGQHGHWHAQTAEWLYVIDGMLACSLGEQTITAAAGTTISVAPGVIHGFWNPTAMPVRFLSLITPGETECYVE